MAIAVVALASRLFGGGAQAEVPYYAEDTREPALVEVLEHSLPQPDIWMALNSRYRVDGAMRCIALAAVEVTRECGRARHQPCRRAEARLADMHMSLWPKGRVGQMENVLRSQVQTYVDAYARLSRLEHQGEIASSRLIRERDNAICRRYRLMIEARLHGQQTRQSG
ncbi:MAG: hypothetical protein AAGH68_15570 [Pseudomonadota bacterium]